MTTDQMLYLTLVLAGWLSFIGLLAWSAYGGKTNHSRASASARPLGDARARPS